MSTIQKPPRAFTLVETLVSITIILVLLVAPFQAVERAAGAIFASRDEIIASAIAQEGIEQIRETRVNNYLSVVELGSANTWLTGLDGANGAPNCIAPSICTIDASPGASAPVATCPNGSTINSCGTPLYINGGMYNQQSSGTASRFYRTVQLTTISGSEAQVKVTVTWVSNHTPYTITLNDYLTNWI
jgi:prepilin-type N-terminal cleavage/methylation domain-containing protein